MLTLRDKLRAICHQLRLSTLLNVESNLIEDFKSRITHLPSSEALSTMNEDALKLLQNVSEKLLYDLDKATNLRSKERAVRDMANKNGLPPYRKPLLAFNLKRHLSK